jgi:hypothetical protein
MDERRALAREDLRAIATYQKVIILCILVYVLAVAAQFLVPEGLRLFLGLGVLALGVVATVFVFLLATKVYSPGLGVLLGLLTLVPCIGLIVLLIINGKATAVLKQHGVRVGFLGANPSDI